MANNRNANTGKFRFPNRPIVPGEDKVNIKHLDLGETTKPVVSQFSRDPLSQQQGQQRTSPGNTTPKGSN